MSSPPPASSNGYNQIRLSPDKAAQPAAPQKWGRAQWMVLTLCMLAYAAVCSELLVFVYIQSAVTTEFRLNAYAFPLLPVATTIVSMLCGPVWGGLADKLGFGRQRTFLFAAAVASLACVASAFAPSFAWLLALRCAATVGGTGLTVVLFVLMAEASPPGKRGKALVILTCAGTAGVLYVAGVAWGLSAIASPAGTWLGYRTWRWLTLAAAIPVVASLGVRLCVGVVPLPHPAEQRALVQATSIPEHTSRSPGALVAVWRRLAHLLAPRFRRRSLCLCVVWFCAEAAYWGTTMYLPTYLNTVDVNPHAITFLMVAAEVPGLVVTTELVDHAAWGRLRTLRWSTGLAAVSTGALALSAFHDATPAVIAASLFQYCTLIPTFAILFAVTPELFPRCVRSSVMGVVNVISSIPAMYTPFLSKYLVTTAHAAWLYPLVWASFLLIAAIAVHAIPVSLEPRGKLLDEELLSGGDKSDDAATQRSAGAVVECGQA